MKLKEVYEAVDALAPFALSREFKDRYGMYDNSGVLIDCGEEISGVLCSLDLSDAAVEEAKKAGANCIVTHHPAIWDGLKSLKEGPVLACAKAGISVISAHLNLDGAEGGIDECLMAGLGGRAAEKVMQPLSRGGYGRVYEVEPASFADFVLRARRVFRTDRTAAYGGGEVRKVASFCGAGLEGATLAFAAENGADTVVSSDGKHHLITEAAERGLHLLLLTHYASENYGFARFALKLKDALGAVTHFTDRRFL